MKSGGGVEASRDRHCRLAKYLEIGLGATVPLEKICLRTPLESH